MAKTQIVESFTTKGELLLEQESGNNAILCRAKYQICSIGEKNRNNRVYEKAVWDKVLADPEISEKLKNRSLFFHAEHPTTTQSNTEKVAGVVTQIALNEAEKKVYAVMEVLDTPYGRIVDTLLRAGCGIGVSTRADGELEEAADDQGNKFQRVVPESYRFVTIDFTADPSTFGSELPIAVERDVTKVISGGLDDSKIDREFATVLLETMHSPEAVALLESIKNDKHHADCQCKASEKKCTKGCDHAVEVSVTETIKKIGDNKWRLYSKDGKKNLGTFDSLEAAKKHEGEVQYFKAHESRINEYYVTRDDLNKMKKDYDMEKVSDQEFLSWWRRNHGTGYENDIEVREKYTTSSDKSGQPANAAAAATVAKKSAAKGKVKLGEQEVQTCPKCGEAFNAIRQGSNPHRCKYDYPASEAVATAVAPNEEKVNSFLSDNWDKFIDHDDAVRNVMSVFKIGVEDAKRIVGAMEASKGKISAVGAMFNEKALPSGIQESQVKEMSTRLATLTAERDKLVENYGKDAMSFTTQIAALKEQQSKADFEIKTINGLAQSQNGIIVEKDNAIAALKEQLEKSNEAKRVLEETHKQAVQHIQEESTKERADHQRQIAELKESQRRDLIKFYAGMKTKSMGLNLPESVLTLLESCKTVDEVDAQIRKTQNALRENLVQSAGVVSEIVIESQSDPNPVLSDIKNKVGIVLKHLGI